MWFYAAPTSPSISGFSSLSMQLPCPCVWSQFCLNTIASPASFDYITPDMISPSLVFFESTVTLVTLTHCAALQVLHPLWFCHLLIHVDDFGENEQQSSEWVKGGLRLVVFFVIIYRFLHHHRLWFSKGPPSRGPYPLLHGLPVVFPPNEREDG